MKAPLILLLLMTVLAGPLVQAQKTRNVEGAYQMRLDDSYCIGEAKRQVVDLARIDAIEKAFGRVVVQGTNTFIENVQTGERVQTDTRMSTIANSLVRGEWVETTREEVKWVVRERFDGEGQELWLVCQVAGKAREITGARADYVAYTLNCAEGEACRTETFREGEDFFLSFTTPVPGYLSVFLQEDETVYRLFPYQRMDGANESCVPVKADLAYTLFDPRRSKEFFPDLPRYKVDPLALEAGGRERAFNRLHVVFSTEPFKKPRLQVDETTEIKTLTLDEYQTWVNQNKARTSGFQVSAIDLTIRRR